MGGGGAADLGGPRRSARDGLTVRWTDPSDGDAFDAWFAAADRAARHGRTDPLVWEREDLRAHLLGHDEDAVHLVAAAHLDGSVVGTASIDVPLRDNHDSATVDVAVVPEHRRSGVGSTLLAFVTAEAERRARTRLEGEAVVVGDGPHGSSPGVGFAVHYGFRVAHTEDHLVLALDPGVRAPATAPAGYTVVSWQDRTPDRYAAAYAAMRAALSADVPRGDLTREPEHWDVDRLRAAERRSTAQGRTTLVTAVVAAGGDVVGHTTLTVPAGDGPEVYQGDTYVMSAHRGRGLGRLLKEHNLSRLADRRGGQATAVHTWTADANAPMAALNRALGFCVVEVTCELERLT